MTGAGHRIFTAGRSGGAVATNSVRGTAGPQGARRRTRSPAMC